MQYYEYLCNINYNSYQEMNFKDILHKFRTESFTEREKGTKFERLMRSWLLTDPRYNELEKVWLWEDFPGRKDFGGTDTGIDLVAKTEMGDYWAIQCKCYAEDAVIDKPAVDSFLATSSRTFTNEVTFQTTRLPNGYGFPPPTIGEATPRKPSATKTRLFHGLG